MDEVSGKRAVDKLPLTNTSSIVMRETSSFLGRSLQPCNSLSCNSRLHMMKDDQGGGARCPQKTKSERSSACHFSTKEVTGSSSKNGSSVSAMRNPKKEAKKKIALQMDADVSETISVRDKLEVPEVVPPQEKIQKGVEESSKKGITMMEVGSFHSGPALISGSRNSNTKNFSSSAPKGERQQPTNPNMSQCGLRDLNCNSVADVFPSSSNSMHNQSLSTRKDLSNGRITEGETSTYRGKKTDETLLCFRNGLSISESRRNRNGGPPKIHRNFPSVRQRRSSGSPSERNTSSSLNEAQFTFSRLTHQDLPFIGNSSSSGSSLELSNEIVPRHFAISSRMEGSSGFSSGAGLSNPDSLGSASRSLINWESFQQYTMEGIAEVLSSLERIELDDSIFEQLVSLETSLFLNSLNIYDQHQDMRMDIDNMTYEELLALEERMGTVSTALTEEALLKCLKRESYQKTKCDDEAAANVDKDDAKCSICLEEYMDDDEVGRIHCEHMYHVDCINQWLRLKNWCPVCKSSAEISR